MLMKSPFPKKVVYSRLPDEHRACHTRISRTTTVEKVQIVFIDHRTEPTLYPTYCGIVRFHVNF